MHSINLLTHITCIQISTCHRYVSICFKDRDTMETFCQDEHYIWNNIQLFIPDYREKIRISIENIPIELQDKKIRTFLSQYVTLVGNTYYPGKRFENTHFITGTRIYSCTTITNHLPRHIYKFGRYLRIRYDSHPTQNQQQQNEEIQRETENIPQQNEEIQKETENIQPVPTNIEEEIPRNITIMQEETPTSSKKKKREREEKIQKTNIPTPTPEKSEDEQTITSDTQSLSENEQQTDTQSETEIQQEIQLKTPTRQIPNLPEKNTITDTIRNTKPRRPIHTMVDKSSERR